ncbi:Hypothetical predicted protein [Lecanosticta acicola]|uniref:C3H1-type domain-containing protein n=1 Tax=Lecanosticta acicola TaxID=111012 RepID=A0AAI9EBK2_9PEZI|nr:Hypothetical predicted protein [Lecanosticta acicola]
MPLHGLGKMSQDPIGTPRRDASFSSSLNGLGNGNLFGVIGGGGGSRFFNNGTPVNSHPLGLDSHTSELYTRFDQIKDAEGQKNKLIEELLNRYQYVQEERDELQKELSQARLASASTAELDHYKTAYSQCISMVKQAPFVLVLVDGDGMIFQNYLLRLGEYGGRQAADILKKRVSSWSRTANIPEASQIAVRIYANSKGLAQTCTKAGIVNSPEVVEDFFRGFTQGGDLFNFIDVGSGKDRADTKMKADFELHIWNVHCQHILFGCSHDNGFARLLEKYALDAFVAPRMTLLEGVPFEKELVALDTYKTTKFEGVFREAKVVVAPDLLTDFSRGRQDSKNAFNPTSGIFTPASSRTPAPQTPLFSPRSGPGVASPAPSASVSTRREPMTRTNSIASSSAVSESLSTGISKESVTSSATGGSGGWANIARASATLPYKDLTRPAPEPKIAGPVIRQNRAGQRLDPDMAYDHDKVYELKKQKYCNQHYIGRGCCHYEAGNGACPHKHDAKLNKDELKWLRVVARETVCKKGTACLEFDCIYGHHCPYPKMMEGSMRGIGCINGDNCRFGREMHGMDTHVYKTIRPGDVDV